MSDGMGTLEDDWEDAATLKCPDCGSAVEIADQLEPGKAYMGGKARRVRQFRCKAGCGWTDERELGAP